MGKKRTEGGKESDKNIKEEMLLHIKVNPESKINEDLRAYMSDIKQSTEARKTSYNQTTNQLDHFVKMHQTQALNQNIAFDSLKRRMNEFSLEQGKVEIMGSRGLSLAASSAVQGSLLLSKFCKPLYRVKSIGTSVLNKHCL